MDVIHFEDEIPSHSPSFSETPIERQRAKLAPILLAIAAGIWLSVSIWAGISDPEHIDKIWNTADRLLWLTFGAVVNHYFGKAQA